MYAISAIGQDSHRFIDGGAAAGRPLLLGGVVFSGEAPLSGNSDADVVLHALCNAISGVTGVNIIGDISDRMCLKEGITNSAEYVKEALIYISDYKIAHVSFSIECMRPKITPMIMAMRENIARLLWIDVNAVCITATSGEGLTDFGRGLGIQVICVLTALCNKNIFAF